MPSASISRATERAPWLTPVVVAEGQGSELLARSAFWSPDDGALLVIAPHPDDEILGAGGLIRTWAARGREVTVLSVLEGDAAAPGPAGPASVRREELHALRKLCLTHVSVTRLGLPADGRMTAHANRLRNAMLPFCREKFTLIAPYEHNGHPDHYTVGNLCVEFARSQNIPIARYAIRAGAGIMGAAITGAAIMGKEPLVKFALSDEARRAKARAIACFRSRIASSPDTPAVTPDAFGDLDRPYEEFVLLAPRTNEHSKKSPKGERQGGAFHGEESTRDLSQKARFFQDG